MVLYFIKKDKIQNYILPSQIDGNYWINDDDNQDVSINIEASNGQWVLKNINNIVLKDYQFYSLKLVEGKEPIILYCAPNYDNTYNYYSIKQDGEIFIGSNSNNQIIIKNNYISQQHAKLMYKDRSWNVEDLNSEHGLYVNGKLTAKKKLLPGDIVFIMGVKIIIVSNFILINNPNNTVTFNSSILIPFIPKALIEDNNDIIEEENEVKLYDKGDYFLRSPRLRLMVKKEKVIIDSPPQKEKEQETPMALTIGPMLTMGMTSMVMGGTAFVNVLNNQTSFGSAMPTLLISFAMMLSMIMWPLLSKKYEKKRKKKNENERQEKYSKYLDTKKKEIKGIIEEQKHTLINNNKTLEECANIILSRKDNLWEKKIDSDDFLSVRVGMGVLDADIEISYPEEHFTIDEDNLKKEVEVVVSASKEIYDVPICVPLTEKYVTAIVGENNVTDSFIDALLLQIMSSHSYEDLKIVFLTSEKNESRWDFLKVLPHCWDDTKSVRYFATNINEMQQLSNFLEEIFSSRMYKTSSENTEINDKDYKNYDKYYLIIVDDLKTARSLKIFEDVANQKINYGFSLLIRNTKMSNLPNECSMFLSIMEEQSGMFENELSSKSQRAFRADFNHSVNMLDCVNKLANIPIEFESEKGQLPDVVGFLEMYDAGKVEQLNIMERWQLNNPVVSLKAPVGIDESGELFNLDLHEKFHGPHGLIAGMTGSGKSEFIITYILSLAVNYHPDEVVFVLIDYKGGGLTGAFENKESKIKLPHLAGTITNLDKVEINRALASIESELRKRQRIFNEAREFLNEGTIDIYKYQRLYREGKVKIPVPHLFIISDEFAELKLQQPEFMDKLISTARIGRSLGVHLVLATQKPSGVVDDQIWSNSKFRVCLKVQDKSDSMDMIKTADAAMLKQVGRFYLQVGYNEFFALGQSAWCGMKYVPVDKRKKKVDSSIQFVDNTGYVLKSIENKKIISNSTETGEELTNIVDYLYKIGERENIRVNQLWLDRIPDVIFVDKLKKKYSYKKTPYIINPIVGEYDDPDNQKQGLLSINLTNEGNTVIYGAPGSGKELMLSTIIYSIITSHSVNEANIYIMDFGAETLHNFKNAPQVADVIFINDKEKIVNLFKLLREEIEKRKKLFVDYNGSYTFYCEKSGSKLPNIIVIINYYEAFDEVYNEYESQFLQLTREGLKYGIIFMITAVGVSTIRYRLLQNFKQQLVLQLNDEMDYATILGNTHGTYPSKIKGRGLVKLGEIYEFQTAYPYEKDMMAEYLKIVSQKLRDKFGKTIRQVPVLPEFVNKDYISEYINKLDDIPIGVEKESLQIVKYDFMKRFVSIITGQDINNTTSFVGSLIEEFTLIDNNVVITIDAEGIFEKINVNNIIYYNNNFDKIYASIKEIIEQQYNTYRENNSDKNALNNHKNITCFIIGFEKFITRLSPEIAKGFSDLLTKSKDLNKIQFILVDSIDKFKTYEYESWYKTFVGNSNGIWVGNGIAEQFLIRLSKTPRSLRDEIGNNFGYFVDNNLPFLIKLLDFNNKKQ